MQDVSLDEESLTSMLGDDSLYLPTPEKMVRETAYYISAIQSLLHGLDQIGRVHETIKSDTCVCHTWMQG